MLQVPLPTPTPDYNMRHEHLVPGDLKGPDNIYGGLEDADNRSPECPKPEEHIGAMTYEQSSSMQVLSGSW